MAYPTSSKDDLAWAAMEEATARGSGDLKNFGLSARGRDPSRPHPIKKCGCFRGPTAVQRAHRSVKDTCLRACRLRRFARPFKTLGLNGEPSRTAKEGREGSMLGNRGRRRIDLEGAAVSSAGFKAGLTRHAQQFPKRSPGLDEFATPRGHLPQIPRFRSQPSNHMPHRPVWGLGQDSRTSLHQSMGTRALAPPINALGLAPERFGATWPMVGEVRVNRAEVGNCVNELQIPLGTRSA